MKTDPLIGRSVGRYRIESVIGRGGMGVVYLAHDDAGQAVALKLMAPQIAGNEAFRERFLREAAVSLDHPGVVPIYDAGVADDELFIAMRYVDGADLKKLILSERRIESARTVSIVEQAAAALDHAHENRIVHRDVKPQNILIETEDGSERTYLTDFGLIKRISPDSSLTTGSHLMGTIYYMAPEQIEGRAVDGRADVYSLGCIVYECLTGSVPYDFETEAAVLWAHMNSSPPAVTDSLPLLPTEVDAVVAKAMARSPDDRYLTAGELAVSLGASLGVSVERPRSLWGSQTSASGSHSRPALRSITPSRSRRPSRSTMGVLAGAAAVLLAAGVSLGVRSQNPGPDRVPSAAVAQLSDTTDSKDPSGADAGRSAKSEKSDPTLPRGSDVSDSLLSPSLSSPTGSNQSSSSRQQDAPRVPAGALEHRTCQGLLPFFWVPADRVAPYVDDRFTLLTELRDDGSGSLRPMAQINVLTFSCDVDLAGDSLGQTERAIVAASIERPQASGPIDATFEFYVLSWFESNPQVADWYLAAPTFSKPSVERVPELAQRFGPVDAEGGRDVRFTAPTSASSPFTMDGVMDRPTPRLPRLIARWWAPHARGALRVQDELHDASFFPARGTITVNDRATDSLLERLLGPDHSRTFDDPFHAHVSGVSITTKKLFACGDKC